MSCRTPQIDSPTITGSPITDAMGRPNHAPASRSTRILGREVVAAERRSRAIDLSNKTTIARDTFAQQLRRTRTVGCNERQPRGAHACELGARIVEQNAARLRRARSRWRVRGSRVGGVEAHVPSLSVLIPSSAEEEAVISSGERVRMGPGAVGGLGMDSSSSTSSAGTAARVGSIPSANWSIVPLVCMSPTVTRNSLWVPAYRISLQSTTSRLYHSGGLGSRVPRYTALRRARRSKSRMITAATSMR